MFRKIAAIWLVVLALSPFTTPFATCDLASFFSNRVGDGSAPPSGHTPLAISSPDTSSAAASAVPPLTSRLDLDPVTPAEAACPPLTPCIGEAVSPERPFRPNRYGGSLTTTLRI
jgi:hypothetical protein